MENDDFLVDFKIVERDITNCKGDTGSCTYTSGGFPEIAHRNYSKIRLGRQLDLVSQYINRLDQNKYVKNDISDVIEEKNVTKEKIGKVVTFKIPSGEQEKLEWTNPAESTIAFDEIKLLHQIRYNFNGGIINDSNEYKSYSGLYNHGNEPGCAGYTISELIWICQSKMSSQINIALYTLCNILEHIPINRILPQFKITHYRWYSYIYRDVNLVNILANLIERNLNTSNTKLLLKILRLIFYGITDSVDFTDKFVSAYELFHSLYPEFGLSIYSFSNNCDRYATHNYQSAQAYMIKESSILDYLSTKIKEKQNIVECIQILTGLIRCKIDHDIVKTVLNHKVFNDVINIANQFADIPNYTIKYVIIKFFRYLYLYSNDDNEQIEYLNELISEDGIELLDFGNYNLIDPLQLKCLIESIKLLKVIADVELIDTYTMLEILNDLCMKFESGHQLIIDCLSEFYLLAVGILLSGKFIPLFQNLASKALKIIDEIELITESHLKILNAVIMFVKLSNGIMDCAKIRNLIYEYLDKYYELNPNNVFDETFDVIFSNNCIHEPIVSNIALVNLLYAINILASINNFTTEHSIFIKIEDYLRELIISRVNYNCDWNIVEKNEYKFHLTRALPLFHCFSKFLGLPLSQFTTINANGNELCNVNQLMCIISLQTFFTLPYDQVIKSLDLLIDRWYIYKEYLTGKFFVTEFFALFSSLPNDNNIVALMDDPVISLKLVKVAQLYLYNISNPIITDGEIVVENIPKSKILEDKGLNFDLEQLLEIYKHGLSVSHVSTIAILILSSYIVDISIVEMVWKDNEIMSQISKSIEYIKDKDGKLYVCLKDIEETIVIGKVDDYVRKELVNTFKEFLDNKSQDFRSVVSRVGIKMYS